MIQAESHLLHLPFMFRLSPHPHLCLHPGPVFGNQDQFVGLAIFLDTFRNDLHGMDVSVWVTVPLTCSCLHHRAHLLRLRSLPRPGRVFRYLLERWRLRRECRLHPPPPAWRFYLLLHSYLISVFVCVFLLVVHIKPACRHKHMRHQPPHLFFFSLEVSKDGQTWDYFLIFFFSPTLFGLNECVFTPQL